MRGRPKTSAWPAMSVESARQDGCDVVVRTTGATVTFDGDGSVAVHALVPRARPVFLLRTEGSCPGPWRLTATDAASTQVENDVVRVRVLESSILQVYARSAVRLLVESRVEPECATGGRRGRMFFDPLGGFGVHAVDGGRVRLRRSRSRVPTVEVPLAAAAEAWVTVFPPREASPVRLRQSLAHEGRPRSSRQGPYPSDRVIDDAARHAQVFALHAYFWKDSPKDVHPRFGRYAGRRCPWLTARHEPSDLAEFLRVRDRVRAAGMAFVVYLSPQHSRAPDMEQEMQRVFEEYGVDGLYLDGLGGDPRRGLERMRTARRVAGPDRILYLNATDQPFGSPSVFLPGVDAYADFVLRGDSGRGGLGLAPFLRYAVAGWNVSNAVGVWCHYGSRGMPLPVERAPSGRHVTAALAAHARIWRRSLWGDAVERFDEQYGPGLGRLVARELGPLRTKED